MSSSKGESLDKLQWRLLVFVVVPIFATAHLALFGRQWRAFCQGCRSLLQKTFGREADNEFTPFVNKHVEKKRTNAMKTLVEVCLLHPFLFISLALALMELVRVFLQIEESTNSGMLSRGTGNVATICVYVISLPVYFVCCSESGWYGLAKSGSTVPRLLYFMVSVKGIALVALFPGWIQLRVFGATVRMALAVANMNFADAVVANTGSTVAFFVSAGLRGDYVAEDIMPELMTLLVICGVAKAMEMQARREALWTVTANSSGNQRKALVSILNAACDVVVQLDPELRIVGPTPKLASMLLYDREQYNRDLNGIQFSEFFASDHEAKNFSDTLLSANIDLNGEEDYKMAEVRNLRLLDRLENGIEVKVLHARFMDLSGQWSFLIGLTSSMDPVSEARLEGKRALSRAETHIVGRRRPSLGGGTPRASMHQALGVGRSRSSGQSSEASMSVQSDNLVLAQPGVVTSQRAKEVTLGATLMTWNYRRKRVVCCPLHAVLQELLRVQKIMSKRACSHSFQPVSMTQCAGCGIVGENQDPGSCFLCASASSDAKINL